MEWENIDNYIFDVDGTLYSQNKVRLRMFFKLIGFYFIRFYKIKEFYALYFFRKLREKKEYSDYTVDKLFEVVGKRINLDSSIVKSVINKWMFNEPLVLLKKYKYKNVIDYINEQQRLGKKIIIYSDYPAIDKLESMGVSFDYLFVSGEKGLVNQKPSIAAMKKILKDTNIDSDKTVYIGDRDDRDKISAESVNIKYYDIKKFKKNLN